MVTSFYGIRNSQPDDYEVFVRLWEACLRMHGAVPESCATERIWDLVQSPEVDFGIRLASRGKGVAAFAIYSCQINSWTGAVDGCLDTLFVSPEMRGEGLGRALVDDRLAIGRARGWQSVFWHVRADNVAARALYNRYAKEDGYCRYRVALAT